MIPHAKIRSALRSLWWKSSPARTEAKRRARIERGLYRCEDCGSLTKDPEVDHLVPVGRTPGAKGAEGSTWDGLIARLFCPADGLQILCPTCHTAKTKAGRAS